MSDKTKKYICTVELNIFEDTDKANIEALELTLEGAIYECVNSNQHIGADSFRLGNFYEESERCT